ncbi:hypothetical protein [Flammeovirga sp. SJP92]|uniref:hypothetical protein n=1 Tax=Flammeovirga sp. SJP92 TaxID=1775430 RepID=UPI0007898693|nr:hypothetical protein [Flammeovirga sp. SJP92]KXX66927.1 hypothetical protein AVL50_29685 [Flammeovirga sp. SJP92]
MKKSLLFSFLFFILTSFTTNTIKGINCINGFCVGMNYTEVEKVLENYKTTTRPFYELGIDSEEECLIVLEKNKEQFGLWFDSNPPKKLKGIILLDESIIIDNSIHIGMTLSDYLLIYPRSKIELDMIQGEYEFISNHNGYMIEFQVVNGKTIGNYNGSGLPTSKFHSTERQIDRIVISK